MSLPPDLDRRAVERYRTGLTMAEVGRELGVSETTVLRALVRKGEPRRPAGRAHKPSLRIVERFRELGDVRATAAACGLTAGYVYHVLSANKVPVRRPRNLDPAKLAEAYAEGLTTTEVGRLFGVSETDVRRLLDRQGVARRSRG